MGLYSPIKSALYMLGSSPGAKSSDAKDKLSFAGKLAAGSLSGGLAAAVTNPTELVKVSLIKPVSLIDAMYLGNCALMHLG